MKQRVGWCRMSGQRGIGKHRALPGLNLCRHHGGQAIQSMMSTTQEDPLESVRRLGLPYSREIPPTLSDALHRLAELTIWPAIRWLSQVLAAAVMAVVDPLRRDDEMAPARCRICECTDDRACGGGCYWVEEDLCSQCAQDLEHLDLYGIIADGREDLLRQVLRSLWRPSYGACDVLQELGLELIDVDPWTHSRETVYGRLGAAHMTVKAAAQIFSPQAAAIALMLTHHATTNAQEVTHAARHGSGR